MTVEEVEEVLDILTWMDPAMADQEAENRSGENRSREIASHERIFFQF